MSSNGSSTSPNGSPKNSANSSLGTGDGGWPAVPPVPVPMKPRAIATEPIDQPPVRPADSAQDSPPVEYGMVDDDSPTMALDADALAAAVGRAPRPLLGALRRPLPRLLGSESSPVGALREAARRRAALANEAEPDPIRDEIWQPRFAYGSGLVIVAVLTVVSLPLWVVLWRITGAPGTQVKDVIALCMMIMGGFLTAAALWAIILEMRARTRMVDALARTGEREGLFEAGSLAMPGRAPVRPASDETTRIPPRPSLGTFIHGPIHAPSASALHVASIAPITVPILPPPGTPGAPPAAPILRSSLFPSRISARIEAEQAEAAAVLEASSRLLTSFSSVLRSFGQLPAQLATLTVALTLFVTATILSLH